jgi:hypothetical protein
LIRSFLVLGFKTILGGVTGALIFLGAGAVLGILGGVLFEIMLPFQLSNLIYIPFYITTGARNALWFGGDFIFVPMIIGSGTSSLIHLEADIPYPLTNKSSVTIFSVTLLFWLLSLALLVFQKFHTLNKINSTYISFCNSIKSQDYPSAYSLFSQEYRRNTNLSQFTEDKGDVELLYIRGCETKKFISSFGKSASIFTENPYFMVTSFGGYFVGPELILESVDGQWLFTGEDNWYLD